MYQNIKIHYQPSILLDFIPLDRRDLKFWGLSQLNELEGNRVGGGKKRGQTTVKTMMATRANDNLRARLEFLPAKMK